MCVCAGVCTEISNFIPVILDISFVLLILLETSICKSSEAYISPSLKIPGQPLCEWSPSLWNSCYIHAVLSHFLSLPLTSFMFSISISLSFTLVASAVLSHGLLVPLEPLLMWCINLMHTMRFNFNDFFPVSKSCTLFSQICVFLNTASCSSLVFPVLLFVFWHACFTVCNQSEALKRPVLLFITSANSRSGKLILRGVTWCPLMARLGESWVRG